MFDPDSRYAGLPVAVLSVPQPDGTERQVRYVRRRFVPPVPASAEARPLEHVVRVGDRLDNVAARYLGNPTQYHRLCDANLALAPAELTEELGRVILVPSGGR